MSIPDAQLCLVSAQPLANLLPALALNAHSVTLAVSADMRERGAHLAAELRRHEIDTQVIEIADAWDPASVSAAVDAWIERVDATQLLNATGGTKIMSLVASEAFRSRGWPVCYQRPDNAQLVWLHAPPDVIELRDVQLALGSLLAIHGYLLNGEDDAQRYEPIRPFLNRMLRLAVGEPANVRALNRLLSETGEHGWRLADEPPALRAVLDSARDRGLVTRDGQRMKATQPTGRALLGGKWLEALVQLRCAEAAQTAAGTSVHANVRVQSANDYDNELDAVIVSRNRLFIVECKTRDGNEDDVYRLDELKALMGGLSARAMLVAPNVPKENVRARARDLGVTIVHGEQLTDLTSILADWIA